MKLKVVNLSLWPNLFLMLATSFAHAQSQLQPALSPAQVQVRIVDLLDGFGPNQYELSSVQFGHPDRVVAWGQGDAGVAAIKHGDLNGTEVKEMHIYIYHEGLNRDQKSTHDQGALGGVKIIQDAQIKNGVNCVSDEKPFQTFYVKVAAQNVLCIKTRQGSHYVLAQVTQVGANGIQLKVLAGPQTETFFAPISEPVAVKVTANSRPADRR